MRGTSIRKTCVSIGRRVRTLILVGLVTPASAAGVDLWVDEANPGCSYMLTREQVTSSMPCCSLVMAATSARAGDTVRIRPGSYVGTVRPAASGSPSNPIRYVAAAGGVTLDA